jgi:glycosyltransferase involved in cell wall biosynthesis
VRDEHDADDFAQLVRLLRRRRSDLFHTHAGITWEGCWGSVAAAEAGVPVVCTEHLPESLAGEDGREFKLRMSRGVARTIAVSHGVARSLVVHGIVAPDRIRVVWNGVDVEAFSPVSAARRAALRARVLDLPPETPLVLCVGRFTPQKGQDVLLEAAALARECEPRLVLLLAGNGPRRGDLARRAAQLGIAGAVRFLGHHRDVPALLGCADVLAQPSRFEGHPLTVLEAMAAALPIVVADVIGCNETVVHGKSGLIVPPEDPSALAEALLQLLGDRSYAARLGMAARRRAEREFAAPVMARRTLAVYREAAQAPAAAA